MGSVRSCEDHVEEVSMVEENPHLKFYSKGEGEKGEGERGCTPQEKACEFLNVDVVSPGLFSPFKYVVELDSHVREAGPSRKCIRKCMYKFSKKMHIVDGCRYVCT
jgi:hypothetical protein